MAGVEYMNPEVLRGLNPISHVCCMSAYSDSFKLDFIPASHLFDRLLNNGWWLEEWINGALLGLRNNCSLRAAVAGRIPAAGALSSLQWLRGQPPEINPPAPPLSGHFR